MDNKKLGMTFHRTFKFQRAPISNILNLAINKGLQSQGSFKNYLIQNIKFGTIYAEAYPRYAIATGLINLRKDSLTPLGEIIANNDIMFSNQQTLWLLHFNMSNKEGYGPGYWNQIIKNFFEVNREFNNKEVNYLIYEFYYFVHNKKFDERLISTSTSVFLQSYISEAGFGSLGLISKGKSGNYKIARYSEVGDEVFYYSLYHSFAEEDEFLKLDTLENSDIKKIFLLNDDELQNKVSNLLKREWIINTKNGFRFVKEPNNIILELYDEH